MDQSSLSFQQNQGEHKISAINKLTTLGQHWECLLFTPGGALNFHRNCWTLMAWKWQNGKEHLETKANPSFQLLPTAGYEISRPIPVLLISPLELYRTLGVLISSSGSTKKSYNILSGYSFEYASAVTSSTLNKKRSISSIYDFFMPTTFSTSSPPYWSNNVSK
jgi:hypothetical protein